MSQETEVISCPACHHALRIPSDWLGQTVQCPECKATFRAPVREGERLSVPELLSRPTPVGAEFGPRTKLDVMLLLPAFGLLLCGVMGIVVNGVFLYLFLSSPEGGKQWAKNQLPAVRQMGFGTPGPPETLDQRDEQDAAQLARLYQWVIPLSLAVSVVTLLGGLSIALRWNYWLAQVGSFMAATNVAHGCCIPGAVAGLWSMLMLNSEEGRAHFPR